MGLMCALFRWKPQEFWDATPHEVMATLEAWEQVNGKSDA